MAYRGADAVLQRLIKRVSSLERALARVAKIKPTPANNKVLWSGGPYFMNSNQSITLSEPASKQPNGIILVWCEYTSGAAVDAQWQYTHIPKVQRSRGGGLVCPLGTFNTTNPVPVRKYIYVVNDTTITGHASNATAPANGFVLVSVLSY